MCGVPVAWLLHTIQTLLTLCCIYASRWIGKLSSAQMCFPFSWLPKRQGNRSKFCHGTDRGKGGDMECSNGRGGGGGMFDLARPPLYSLILYSCFMPSSIFSVNWTSAKKKVATNVYFKARQLLDRSTSVINCYFGSLLSINAQNNCSFIYIYIYIYI